MDCSPNASAAFSFLTGAGLRDFQAAAVIGNLQQESGGVALDPRAYNPGEGAYGVAQWRAGRWQNLIAYAAQSGRDPWSFDLQLEFLWRELQSVPAFGLVQLKEATTIEDAVVVFQNSFERCGDCNTPARTAYARAALLVCPVISPPIIRRGFPVAAALGAMVLAATTGFVVQQRRAERRREEPPDPFAYP